MGILGYLESKEMMEKPIMFILVPFVGIAICYTWYRMIYSYKTVKKAKYQVIHTVEKKLPLAMFETEWEILSKEKKKNRYRPLSAVEMYIPLIFVVLYLMILFANAPLNLIWF